MFIAQPVTESADADKDGRITAAEWTAMAERWWSQWDKARKGSVNEEQIVDGLSAVFPPPPGFGGPGGSGGPPNGRGGPGGPPPR
jgi:endonuclease YncB( thermonuclease family)